MRKKGRRRREGEGEGEGEGDVLAQDGVSRGPVPSGGQCLAVTTKSLPQHFYC